MRDDVAASIASAIRELYDVELSVDLTRPDEQFGDYSTNVAMKLAKQLGKDSREIAAIISEELRVKLAGRVSDASVAGPGFINLKLADSALASALAAIPGKTLGGQTIVAEYSDPNPFKVLHAGHLYTSVVGDAIANLLANAGARVHRVNFGGDVGLHVGKTLWAILQKIGGENPSQLNNVEPSKRAEWMAEAYVTGTNAYEENEAAKAEIIELNKKVYGFHSANDHDSPLAQIYWTCRTWSYDYFDEFYASIGTSFEKYYPESSVADLGLTTVKKQLENGIFEESDGAVIFRGEKYGLHTRVFINREGIPTYEAKDVGLIMRKYADYHFDKSFVITGNEQAQYMAVVLKAVEQFEPELVEATSHLTHGLVKLSGGEKMSSRKGNILRAVDVLEAARHEYEQSYGKKDERVSLAAVKYAFLKQRLGGDIIYDPKESVSLEGNSGPYLQYAHARAKSILAKADEQKGVSLDNFEVGERPLARKISEYPEVVELATDELMPHHICTYLYELAQEFNRFYEKNRVIGDPREAVRLALVTSYADKLKQGLSLLGITAPDKM